MAQRFDIGGDLRLVEGSSRTPLGALVVEARPTCAGVLTYRRGGKVYRELRPPEEIKKILKNIPGMPIIPVHKRVGPNDSAEFEGIHVGDVVFEDDGWVRTGAHIMAAKAIEDIEKNRRRQLSGGYVKVDFEETPGKWDQTSLTYRLDGDESPEGFDETRAVPFDGVQRNLDLNHSCLCPQGRAGAHGAVRFDSLDDEDGVEVRLDEEDQARDDQQKESKVKIKINGIEFEVSEGVAIALQAEKDKEKSRLDSLTNERDDFKGQVTALTTERDTLKGEKVALEKQANERNDSADAASINERLRILAVGQKAKVDYLQKNPLACTKTNEEIMRDAVAKRYDSLDVKSASDAEVAGMFKVLEKEQPARFDSILKVAAEEEKPVDDERNDADDYDKVEADFFKRMENQRQPVTV